MMIVSPFPVEHVGKMWDWLQDFSGQMVDDYCPKSLDELAAKNLADLERGAKSFAIVDTDGVPLGAIWGELLGDGQFMGHLVFDRKYPFKAEALRMALRLFFQAGARKVCWQIFADNKVFQNFLRRRIGAQVEGKFRQATRRNGELVDVVVMASFPEDVQ